MSPLIFLDIDGVMHPRSGSPLFLDSCMGALRKALHDYDIKVIISSTWREDRSVDELRELVRPLNKPLIGITPVIDEPFVRYIRYQEVLKYLDDSNQKNRCWLAIDDTRGFYPPDAPVFWTNPATGFLRSDIPKLKNMLFQISD